LEGVINVLRIKDEKFTVKAERLIIKTIEIHTIKEKSLPNEEDAEEYINTKIGQHFQRLNELIMKEKELNSEISYICHLARFNPNTNAKIAKYSREVHIIWGGNGLLPDSEGHGHLVLVRRNDGQIFIAYARTLIKDGGKVVIDVNK
jgi:hypothetical protein